MISVGRRLIALVHTFFGISRKNTVSNRGTEGVLPDRFFCDDPLADSSNNDLRNSEKPSSCDTAGRKDPLWCSLRPRLGRLPIRSLAQQNRELEETQILQALRTSPPGPDCRTSRFALSQTVRDIALPALFLILPHRIFRVGKAWWESYPQRTILELLASLRALDWYCLLYTQTSPLHLYNAWKAEPI